MARRRLSGYLPNDIGERLLDHLQACEFLQVSPRTLENMKTRGAIPFVRVPGTKLVRFRLSTLLEIAEQERTLPVAS